MLLCCVPSNLWIEWGGSALICSTMLSKLLWKVTEQATHPGIIRVEINLLIRDILIFTTFNGITSDRFICMDYFISKSSKYKIDSSRLLYHFDTPFHLDSTRFSNYRRRSTICTRNTFFIIFRTIQSCFIFLKSIYITIIKVTKTRKKNILPS